MFFSLFLIIGFTKILFEKIVSRGLNNIIYIYIISSFGSKLIIKSIIKPLNRFIYNNRHTAPDIITLCLYLLLASSEVGRQSGREVADECGAKDA